MRIPLLLQFMLLVWSQGLSQYIVKIELTAGAPVKPDDTLYLAGSFNGWNPRDPDYRLQPGGRIVYFLNKTLPAGSFEYKVTRGSWEKAECKSGGEAISNRLLKLESDTVIRLMVEEWADRVPPKPKQSTASKQVKIVHTSFYSPQLRRYKRIWVYLPKTYNARKKYPVLYMHDGQNLFEDSCSYSGEWGVDEYLDSLKSGACIVVGIDHGGAKRFNEYNPYGHARFGKGEGSQYADFIVKTLKPWVDKKFNTLRGQAHTFIAGSSMGGLISLYTLLKYPKVFGGAGIFSPAFWTAPAIMDQITKQGKAVKGRVFFYAGKQEDETMAPLTLQAMEKLRAVSSAQIRTIIRNDGMHNEARWRVEFPLFYEWLLQSQK